MDENYFGNIFRDIRENKNLSQSEAAEDAISTSQLSKFENGVSDLSLHSLESLLHNINFSLSEYFEHADQCFVNHKIHFLQELTESYLLSKEDQAILVDRIDDELRELAINQKDATSRDTLYLNVLITKRSLLTNMKMNDFPDNYRNLLTESILTADKWYAFELVCFTNVIPIFTPYLLDTVASELITCLSNASQTVLESKLVFQAIIRLVFHLMSTHNYMDAQKIIDNVSVLQLSEHYLFDRTIILFAEGIVLLATGNLKLGTNITTQVIQYLKLCKYNSQAQLLQIYLDKIREQNT